MVNGMNGKKLLLILGLLLCSGPGHALSIFACEPEWGALARVVAGPDARITVAIAPGQDPHHIQARPTLISAVRRADMVVCNGAGLETGWLPVLLSRGANPSVQREPGLFLAAEHVSLLDKSGQADRSQGDIHPRGNPHVHLDPRNLPAIASALAVQLGKVDRNRSAQYEQNARHFTASWTVRTQRWQQQSAPLNKTPVVVHHRSWNYLLDWLGMYQLAELEPKPGLPPAPGHLASLIEEIDPTDTTLILYTSFNGDQAADWLAQRTAACAVELPFTVESDDGETALAALFDQLLTRLLQAQQRCSNE